MMRLHDCKTKMMNEKKKKERMKGERRECEKKRSMAKRECMSMFFWGREYEGGGEIHMQRCQTQKQTVRRSGSMVRKDNSQNPNA